ncbi:MAG: hypothetical protein GY862_27600 [Gammaproteobacteria bacterium]|nr:hypothetical protein [Gammaproteobacteria bacterium]
MFYRILQLLTLVRRKFIQGNNSSLKMFVFSAGMLGYAAWGFMYFESPLKPGLTWTDAIWWSLVTMTTVGYGDFLPETFEGKYLVGIPTMIFGIGFLGFVISEIVSGLIETRSRRIKGMNRITSDDHILIVNFSSLERMQELVKEIRQDPLTQHKDICLIDETLSELPDTLLKNEILFVKGDPTSEAVLEQAALKEASHIVILVKDPNDPHGDDQNLAAMLVINSVNPRVFSIVEVQNPQKISHFKLAGCNNTVCVSRWAINLIAQELLDPGVKDVIHELTSSISDQRIYLVPIKQMQDWKYKGLVLWGLAHGCSVLGLMRGGTTLLHCGSDDEINDTDKAILIGKERVTEIKCT